MRTVVMSLALVALGAGAALAASASDLITPRAGMGQAYQEMATRIAELELIRSIPFFSLTPAERLGHVSGYGSALVQRNVKGFAQSVSADFSRSAMMKDVGVALASNVLGQMAQGATLEEGIGQTWKYVSSSEFLFGQLLGGLTGAALGALIPVPGLGGVAGQILSQVPLMAGSMLGGTLGYKGVEGLKAGTFDLGALFRSIDYLDLACQAVGSTAGMVLGNFLPVPGLGPIIGGATGSMLGLKVAGWLRGRWNALRGTTAVAATTSDAVPSGGGVAEAGAAPEAETVAAPQAPTSTDAAALKAQRDAAYRRVVASAQLAGNGREAREALAGYRLADAALAEAR